MGVAHGRLAVTGRASFAKAQSSDRASGFEALRVRTMLEASCLRDADGDCLVVETEEPAFRLALSDLFFDERNGRHVRRSRQAQSATKSSPAFSLNSIRSFVKRPVSNLPPGRGHFGRRPTVSTPPVSSGGSQGVPHSRSAASTSPRGI